MTPQDPQPQPHWNPRDFIVGGRYCDISHTVAELEGLRRSRDATALVLIVFREDTFFRPLLRIVHRATHRIDELQTILTARTAFPKLAKRGASEDLIELLCRAVPVDELGLARESTTILQRLEQAAPRVFSDPTPPVARPASVVVFDFGGQASGEDDPSLDRLLLMVNTSAPVIAHRELEAQLFVRDSLEAIERRWRAGRLDTSPSPQSLDLRKLKSNEPSSPDRDWNPERYATMLLEVALTVTRSTIGNIYMATRDGGALHLVAKQSNEIDFQDIDTSGRLPSVVARVYERGRALIINDVDDYQRSNPHVKYLSVVDDPDIRPYAELAVPIEQAPFASAASPRTLVPRSKPIGVINVERVRVDGSEVADYTPTDLAALQTVAFLYALRRAGSLTTFSAESLARLTEHNALLPPDQLNDADAGRLPSNVPIDLLPARPTIEFIAEQIYGLTRSTSVVFRVLSADQSALVRFVAVPDSRLNDEHESIAIRAKDSVNAWVARAGVTCYIPNIADKPQRTVPGLQGVLIVKDREPVSSELCVPIAVHGSVVGTLNLESQHKSDYPDDTTAVVRALAEQVGLAIAQARRADEWRLFSFHANQTSKSHHILQHVDDIERIIAAWGETWLPEAREALTETVEELRRASDPYHWKSMDSEPAAGGVEWTDVVVKEILAWPQFVGRIERVNDPPPKAKIAGVVGHVLRMALSEMLHNAVKEVSADPQLKFPVRMRLRLTRRGGRDFLQVVLANKMGPALPPDMARELYRRPIVTSRRHMGAYIAGSYARSVGGEIYIAHAGPGEFVAIVEVPIISDEEADLNVSAAVVRP